MSRLSRFAVPRVNPLRRLVKLLFAHHHQQKLENFSATFEEHRRQFDRVVNTRFAARSIQLSESIQSDTRNIMGSLTSIKDGLADAKSLIEKHGADAKSLIEKHGADAIINVCPSSKLLRVHDDLPGTTQNMPLLRELGNKLGERVDENMQRTLSEGFDVLLRKNT